MSLPTRRQSEIEKIGLQPAAGWYVASGIFFLTGFNLWLGGLLGIDVLANTTMRIVAAGGIVGAPIWFYFARRNVSERWLHVPIFLGMMNILAMALVLGPESGAFAVIFMSALLPPAYLHGLRFAAPHFALGAACVTYAIIASDEPFSEMRAPISVATMLFLLTMLSMSHEALARVVAVNRGLAEIDPLTGVANVRVLRERLYDEIERAERRGGRLALFSIDLDNFKEVNDRFGHSVGDSILRETSTAMAGCLDPADLLARRGGDEFSVIAPMTAGRDADDLAARLADAVANVRRGICPDVLPSASVGYVLWSENEDVAELIDRSDAALHGQKLEVHPDRVVSAVTQLSRPIVSLAASSQRLAAHESRRAAPVMESRGAGARGTIGAVGFTLAGVFGIVGAIFGGQELSNPAAVGIAAIEICCVPICLWLERGSRWRHGVSVMIGVAIVLVTAQIFATGQAGSAFVDMYMAPVVFFFYAAMKRSTWPRLLGPVVFAGSMGLFALFLIHTSYPFTSLRLVASVNVLAVAAGLFVLTDRQIRRYNARNKNLARTDSLTGLANVRQLGSRLDDEIARCMLTGDRFSLFMVDLDEFKQVNDRISHAAGDQTLVSVAAAIEDCVRADELAARRGGDEFAIVTGPAETYELEALLDRLSAAISQARRAECGELLSSASVGYATWRPGESRMELMQRADKSLNDAKCASRHQRMTVSALQTAS